MKPNTWAMLCHLLGFVGYLGNGLGCVVAPLILWLVKKDEIEAVNRHGRAALNFNLSVCIYGLVLFGATVLTFGFGAFVTGPLLIALGVFHIACVAIAAIKANKGEEFKYPLTLELVKSS